ncbi:MAG TPA: ATP-binding cassette domain-containing protein [Thermoanaerobaculia bacterium]|nr:ATP-binding cassette domain-containing protein [Thermoanaerobaculia bacterium]
MADESNSCSLAVRGITKQYGDFLAVDDLSLAVPGGTIFGLLGPNGAGKTTTIRMIMDIIAPDHGEVRFFGRPRKTDDLKRIGYLPEERGLYRKMKVTEHLVFLGELHGLSKRDAVPRIEEWLERVELGEWADKKVEELSKGMQQKIQLIGTLLHDPEIVILDEPFSGLDPINQSLFKELLASYKSEGRTILFSTHVMEQAEKLCDEIALISKGKVVLDGELAKIKRDFGENSYQVRGSGDLARLAELPEVEHAQIEDGSARLFLKPGARGSEVLHKAVTFASIDEFTSDEPELGEIFIKAVHDAA